MKYVDDDFKLEIIYEITSCDFKESSDRRRRLKSWIPYCVDNKLSQAHKQAILQTD